MTTLFDDIKWNDAGLIPAIAQDQETNEVLMVAWMNQQALQLTVESRKAVYWSRSRQQLWHKGEQSGHEQLISEIRLDCDSDVILLKVDQKGGIACHTGRKHCFFKVLRDGKWVDTDPVLKKPKDIYK